MAFSVIPLDGDFGLSMSLPGRPGKGKGTWEWFIKSGRKGMVEGLYLGDHGSVAIKEKNSSAEIKIVLRDITKGTSSEEQPVIYQDTIILTPEKA